MTESRELCTPADRDGAGVHDQASHLHRYQIVGATDTMPVTLCSGSTGCAGGACTCDGLGSCTGAR